MPVFSNAPPDGTASNALTLIRTPATGRLACLIASSDVTGCPTHFWGGRTIPHEQKGCKPCEARCSWRWHSYCIIQQMPTGQMFLLELTAQATEPLIEYRKIFGSLRGAALVCERRGKRANGRVMVKINPPTSLPVGLPKAPDVVDILCSLWGFDPARGEEYKSSRQQPAVAINAGPDRVRDRPDVSDEELAARRTAGKETAEKELAALNNGEMDPDPAGATLFPKAENTP